MTEVMATKTTDSAMPTYSVVGMSSRPLSDSITVMPENRTARFAVLPVTVTASSGVRPRASSSRKRCTDTSE